ncbi:hypothetical protein N9019_02535, partial [Akkermansiaceae bacterium]|nr:hypothetical protein [Akkermansiaceae bacterium]
DEIHKKTGLAEGKVIKVMESSAKPSVKSPWQLERLIFSRNMTKTVMENLAMKKRPQLASQWELAAVAHEELARAKMVVKRAIALPKRAKNQPLNRV